MEQGIPEKKYDKKVKGYPMTLNDPSRREDATCVPRSFDLGATLLENGRVRFRVWGPRARVMAIKFPTLPGAPEVPMERDEAGYFTAESFSARPGLRYLYVIDGQKERPDPASRFQPEGVHGPSAIVDPDNYRWHDQAWRGIPLEEFIFYEMHVGTFTPQGTFDAAIARLRYLKRLGITCVEVMPVAQFPGSRNWGYDGVGLFAVQNTYGGPEGFKKFVDACHREDLAVCLDVVYNHLGPEGNYLSDYGPYFTNRYHTPWGDAINYDGPDSDPVRHFVISNAVYWVREYHVDALRLDAVHGIYDFSARHILEEIQDAVQAQAQALGRRVYVIAESDLNDARLLRPKRKGGYALDAQWCDDFHHSVHVTLTGEKNGYYQDYQGVRALLKALRHRFVFDGIYSHFRRRRHGNSACDLAPCQFVVCIQNHDQVGNRAVGDRLSTNISFPALKAAAAINILSPYLPLLFMGEEYAETRPFPYFIDHKDPRLVEAVRRGRQQEFAAFGWRGMIPDPADPNTFQSAKLNWMALRQKAKRAMLAWYRDLIGLRRLCLARGSRRQPKIKGASEPAWVGLEYGIGRERRMMVLISFSEESQCLPLPSQGRQWREVLNSEWREYGGGMPARKRTYRGQIELGPYQVCVLRGRA